jgi:intein-encoded DNA endonuclease-like protein
MDSFCNGKLQGVELCIGSQYMCNSLNNLGVTTAKTFTLRFPDIPEKYISHFVRGYFDGDGCISCFHPSDYSDNVSRYQTIFVGNEIFLNNLNEVLNKYIGLGIKNVKKEKNINLYRLVYSTSDSIKLANWMYKSNKIRLERKYKKFQQLLKERNR